jgi:hypothetical protein
MSQPIPDGMPHAEIPNDQVAGVAREFRQTADFLYAHLQEHTCVSPLLMVAAFGIELFLKCLNSECVYHQDDVLKAQGGYRVTAKPREWGHRLVSLLDALDEGIRNGLDEAYAKTPVVRRKATLKDALAAYDRLFEDSRYPFEDGKDGDGRDISGLVRLLDLIADHVGSLPPRAIFPNPLDE